MPVMLPPVVDMAWCPVTTSRSQPGTRCFFGWVSQPGCWRLTTEKWFKNIWWTKQQNMWGYDIRKSLDVCAFASHSYAMVSWPHRFLVCLEGHRIAPFWDGALSGCLGSAIEALGILFQARKWDCSSSTPFKFVAEARNIALMKIFSLSLSASRQYQN